MKNLKFQHPIKQYSTLSKVWGFKTIKEGERAAVYSKTGDLSLVQGPQRVFLFGSEYKELKRLIVSPNEFLKITKTSGKKQFKIHTIFSR
jgi:hypothetical protein